jgi:hypothetical protein
MGQRHQVYVIRKTKEGYTALGAFHLQCRYGLSAATDLIRLVEAVSRAKTVYGEWDEYSLYGPREISTLVTHIYGVEPSSGYVSTVHDEREYLIKDDVAHPENGDNNDGAGLVVIDETKKEARGCLFTPQHVEGEHGKTCKAWKAYAPAKYVRFYYTDSELLKTDELKRSILSRSVKPILQAEFEEIFEASVKKARVK